MGPSSFNDGDDSGFAVVVNADTASMGPSSFNDGDVHSPVSFFAGPYGFNGAVVFQRRRRRRSDLKRSQHRSLQWGRRLSTTETCVRCYFSPRAFRLQWGRRLSTTETVMFQFKQIWIERASMGPSSFNDGDCRSQSSTTLSGQLLQWGRRLSTTET